MKLRDHFMNPQSFGKIRGTKYVGKNRSGFCGDTIEVYLEVKDDIIIRAKYQACGCWALIASASVMSEYVKDRTLKEIENLSDEDYFRILGDFPKEKRDCVMVTKYAFVYAAKKEHQMKLTEENET